MNYNTKYLYHVTPIDNLPNILKEGLKCDEEGYIYLYEERKFIHPIYNILTTTTHMIAVNQIFIKDGETVGVLKINVHDVLDKLEPDDVPEMTSKLQYRIKCDRITPEKIVKCKKVVIIDPNEYYFNEVVLKDEKLQKQLEELTKKLYGEDNYQQYL